MKDYQGAISRIIDEYIPIHYEGTPMNQQTEDALLLQELVNEKLEQESRKDKLIVGSRWVCDLDNIAQEFGNYKPHVENIKKGLIVEVFDVNGLIIFGHNQSMESWFMGEEQFIACFRPLKKGGNRMNKYKTTINICLNGAGIQYHVKEDVETVKNAFRRWEDSANNDEFCTPPIFTDVMYWDEILPMVIINPAGCATIEIYKIYSARKGK